MAGLVSYESSGEDEDDEPMPLEKSLEQSQPDVHSTDIEINGHSVPESRERAPVSTGRIQERAAVYGPQLGPSAGPSFPPLEEDLNGDDGAPRSSPGSPFSANRASLRDLTLPPVPNMDIPPSPPGSPPPATNKKFENFLELKKKGVHFNSRISESPALKNPALMDKLLSFVDLDQKEQYRTTLGSDIWDPKAFPRWAFKEQLKQSQTEVGQSKARNKGAPVEFVTA